jgi:hypothetical protein
MRRLDEAVRVVDLDRPGLCPQCGFACLCRCDRRGLDLQVRKLELLVATARDIWAGSNTGVRPAGSDPQPTQPNSWTKGACRRYTAPGSEHTRGRACTTGVAPHRSS